MTTDKLEEILQECHKIRLQCYEIIKQIEGLRRGYSDVRQKQNKKLSHKL